MKKLCLALLAMATALAIAPSASATPIAGAISVSGNNIDTFTSTAIAFTGTANAEGLGGTLASVLGSATLTGFTYSAASGVELIDVTTGPDNPVTFTINGAIDEVVDTSGNLDLTGFGTLMESGYDPTPASFTLTSSETQYGYSLEITAGSTSTPTPEPSSLLLLGTGLLGLAFVAFRKAKASGVVLSMHSV